MPARRCAERDFGSAKSLIVNEIGTSTGSAMKWHAENRPWRRFAGCDLDCRYANEAAIFFGILTV
jgi:hypothetical protein